jgi:CDP-glucose 4,6-dehydratase
MDWKNKNILVTGMFGFFAPHIAKQLSKLGANVIGSFHDQKQYSYCQMNNLSQDITLADLDINDLNRIKEIICNYEVEYIFHCAANAIVRTCVHNPIGAFTTNIMGTANVLEAARDVGGVKGLMCMESDKTYGSFEKNN